MKKIFGIICLFFFALSASAVDRKSHIVIDKKELQLYVINQTDTLFRAPVCCGKRLGDKQRSGDYRTPEGTFTICSIHNSKDWIHDAHDGNGPQKDCYGPWFFRLKTPKWTSIGIHGTRAPSSIGTRASEGCIRLTNENVCKLKPFIFIGMKVTILPD